MNTRVSLATFAGILGLAAVAQAGTISSPAIFGSHDQNQAYCVVLNAGTTTQTVTVRILTESGTAVVVGTQTIAPGQFVVAFAASLRTETAGPRRRPGGETRDADE
jgi:hypothetical protein